MLFLGIAGSAVGCDRGMQKGPWRGACAGKYKKVRGSGKKACVQKRGSAKKRVEAETRRAYRSVQVKTSMWKHEKACVRKRGSANKRMEAVSNHMHT